MGWYQITALIAATMVGGGVFIAARGLGKLDNPDGYLGIVISRNLVRLGGLLLIVSGIGWVASW